MVRGLTHAAAIGHLKVGSHIFVFSVDQYKSLKEKGGWVAVYAALYTRCRGNVGSAHDEWCIVDIFSVRASTRTGQAHKAKPRHSLHEIELVGVR